MIEVVFCIVNEGYSEMVMDSARSQGATGGTVIRAKGTANPDAEKIFGVTIEPEKEIVMILIDEEIKENLLHTLYNKVGSKTSCNGIIFTMPVSDVVGIPSLIEKGKEKEKK